MIAVQRGTQYLITYESLGERIGAEQVLHVTHPNLRQIKKRCPHLSKWDGVVKFSQPVDDGSADCAIAIGLLPRLQEHLTSRGLSIAVTKDEDWGVPVPFHQLLKGGIVLDDQQVSACVALLENPRCALEFKTGSGKTEIATNAMLCLQHAGVSQRALFVVPRLNLLYKTAERIAERAGCPVGLLGDGNFDIGHSIVVATADTAVGDERLTMSYEIRQWLTTLDTVVLDEAHHSVSDRWQKLIAQCAGAARIWAISGKVTYLSKSKILDHMKLEELFGPPVLRGHSEKRTCPTFVLCHKYPAWDGTLDGEGLQGTVIDGCPLIYRDANGVWTEAVFRGLSDEGRVPSWMLIQQGGKWKADKSLYGVYPNMQCEGGEWRIEIKNKEDIVYWTRHDVGIVANEARNAWAVRVAQECARAKEPFMITVKRRKHLQRMLRLCGKSINVAEIGGHLTGSKQTKVLDAFAAGKYSGIVAVASTVSEGTDLPMLQHLIKCDGDWSEQLLEQQLGRVMRVWEKPAKHSFAAKRRGIIHIPRDSQHKALDKATGHVLQYYRTKGQTVKTVTYLSEEEPVEINCR